MPSVPSALILTCCILVRMAACCPVPDRCCDRLLCAVARSLRWPSRTRLDTRDMQAAVGLPVLLLYRTAPHCGDFSYLRSVVSMLNCVYIYIYIYINIYMWRYGYMRR